MKKKPHEIIIPPIFKGEELEAVSEMITMTKEELFKIPFEKKKIMCCVVECRCSLTMHDFGLFPLLWYKGQWWNLEHSVFFCAKHWKTEKIIYSKTKDLPIGKYKERYKEGPAIQHLKP